MLKVKQRPGVELTPPAAMDIESGVTAVEIQTDIAGDELNPPMDHPPIILAIHAVQTEDRPDNAAASDCQPQSEQAQHSHAPRMAVLRDTTNEHSV